MAMRMMRFINLSQGPSIFLVCSTLLLASCDPAHNEPLKQPSPQDFENPHSAAIEDPESLPVFGDLTSDTLIPPEQPELSIAAQPGTLTFKWQPVDDQHRARLFRHDPPTGGESLSQEFDDPSANAWQLPSRTHTTAWHRQQYRVELCALDDCVSSARVPLIGLAAETIATLSPAVFIQGERYAERVALNHDATVAVLTLPMEGALEIQARIGEQWQLIQRLRLDALSLSTSRSLDVALSMTGDTLAVFVRNGDATNDQQIRILERLGEAWLQTAAWPVEAVTHTASVATAAMQKGTAAPETSISLSSNGDQVFLHAGHALNHFRLSEAGWVSAPQSFAVEEGTASSGLPEQLSASALNADFTRAFTLGTVEHSLYLNLWTPAENSGRWHRRARFPLQGLSAGAQLAMTSNAAGTAVAIAGWDDVLSDQRSAVMWRYAVDSTAGNSSADTVFSLQVMDSLRSPPTEHVDPVLVFSADATLSIMALGWHSADETSTLSNTAPDAALSTYVFEPQSRQWLSALELPENLPTLAKQSFARELALSADGMTMIMTGKPDSSISTGSAVNEILVMR